MGCTPSKSSKPVTLNTQFRPEAEDCRPKSSPEKSNSRQNTKIAHANSTVVSESNTGSKKQVEIARAADECGKLSTNANQPATRTPPEKSEEVEKTSPEVIELTYEEASKLQPKDPDEMWAIVKGTSEKEGIHIEPTKNRKGWRTIRIFVSSTFKDFHQEREVLVKEVRLNMHVVCSV